MCLIYCEFLVIGRQFESNKVMADPATISDCYLLYKEAFPEVKYSEWLLLKKRSNTMLDFMKMLRNCNFKGVISSLRPSALHT